MILALAAMSVIVFVNVMLRYLTSESIVWAEEVARYLMIWLTFLGIGPVMRIGGHIAIDNLQDALARPWRGRCASSSWRSCWPPASSSYGSAGASPSAPWCRRRRCWRFLRLCRGRHPGRGALAVWHLLAIARGFVTERKFEQVEDFDPAAAGSL